MFNQNTQCILIKNILNQGEKKEKPVLPYGLCSYSTSPGRGALAQGSCCLRLHCHLVAAIRIAGMVVPETHPPAPTTTALPHSTRRHVSGSATQTLQAQLTTAQ